MLRWVSGVIGTVMGSIFYVEILRVFKSLKIVNKLKRFVVWYKILESTILACNLAKQNKYWPLWHRQHEYNQYVIN